MWMGKMAEGRVEILFEWCIFLHSKLSQLQHYNNCNPALQIKSVNFLSFLSFTSVKRKI